MLPFVLVQLLQILSLIMISKRNMENQIGEYMHVLVKEK